MGMVKIGDRELRVIEQHEPGSFLQDFEVTGVQEEMAKLRDDPAARPLDLLRKFAELVLCFVKKNNGVNLDWLMENLPSDVGTVIRQCVVASGRTPKEPATQGEALRP